MAGEFVHREDSRELRKMEVMGVTREKLFKPCYLITIEASRNPGRQENMGRVVEEK